jgi:ribonuclease D
MAALAKAEPLDADDLPAREPRRPGLTKDGALVADLLKLLLKIRAKESGVASKLIARSDELEMLAAGVRDGLNILSGWRFDAFGGDALDLVEGRLAFATEHGRLKLTRPEAVQDNDSPAEAYSPSQIWRRLCAMPLSCPC